MACACNIKVLFSVGEDRQSCREKVSYNVFMYNTYPHRHMHTHTHAHAHTHTFNNSITLGKYCSISVVVATAENNSHDPHITTAT